MTLFFSEIAWFCILLWLSYQIWTRCNASLSCVILIKISFHVWNLVKFKTITKLYVSLCFSLIFCCKTSIQNSFVQRAINCSGWWSKSKMCVVQTTLTFLMPSPIFKAPYVELVPSFSIASAPHVGMEPEPIVEICQMDHPQGTNCCSKVI